MIEGIWEHGRRLSTGKVSHFLFINFKSHEADRGCRISTGVCHQVINMCDDMINIILSSNLSRLTDTVTLLDCDIHLRSHETLQGSFLWAVCCCVLSPCH